MSSSYSLFSGYHCILQRVQNTYAERGLLMYIPWWARVYNCALSRSFFIYSLIRPNKFLELIISPDKRLTDNVHALFVGTVQRLSCRISNFLPFRLSSLSFLYPSIILSFYPSILLSFYPSILLSFYPFILLSFYPSIILSFYHSILLSFYPSILLSFYPSILLSFYPSILLSFWPSIFPFFNHLILPFL